MILLVGGTGSLGGRVGARLIEAGLPLRVLVRPKTDATHLDAAGAEVVRGDLSEASGLADACAGVVTVVSTVIAMGRRLGGDRAALIHNVDQSGVATLVRAAEQAGVERFVYVSYAGVDAGLGFP
jgi:uncharacterized protein YbjT (DUF2867 family)